MIRRTFKNFILYKNLVSKSVNSKTAECFEFPAFVINLKRCVERKKYIASHLSTLGISHTIVDAIDGYSLSYTELLRQKKYDDNISNDTFNRSLTLPEIGCALSHLSIYQTIVREGIPISLVIEDDAYFFENSTTAIRVIMQQAPEDWGIIQLRCDCKDYRLVGNGIGKYLMKECLPVASTAYLIKNHAAAKIIENIYPIRYPADSLLGRAWKWDVNLYGSVPDLVAVNNIFPSAIQEKLNLRFRMSNATKNIILKVFG